MEFNNYMISNMTNHFIDLIQFRQFDIIIYSEVNFSFIIFYLTYITFLVNFF